MTSFPPLAPLADNRHYTFYVWKKILSPNLLVRYLWAPVYSFCTLAMWIVLAQADKPWAAGPGKGNASADGSVFDSSDRNAAPVERGDSSPGDIMVWDARLVTVRLLLGCLASDMVRACSIQRPCAGVSAESNLSVAWFAELGPGF
jgi:hypothetical protein